MRRDPTALQAALAELDRAGLRRVRRRVDAADAGLEGSSAHVEIEGRRLVSFCSNDYLGLARHPEVAAAMGTAAARYGVGSGAAHLVSGHGPEHERLEEALAAFTGRERALLFSTGYMANLGAVTALVGHGDLVIEDRLDHASLIDAARLSGARLRRYRHADAEAAAALLAHEDADRTVVLATDGVFSMDGDLAPLAGLAAIARARGAWLLVDDAHGLGVLGPSGRGALEQSGLGASDVPLLVGTLGKAFGTFGAFVAGDAAPIELLLQRARTYLFTTALPQAVAAATLASLRVAERESWRRERVLRLVQRFRDAAQRAGIALGASFTPIQPIELGTAGRAVAASRALEARGYWVSAIRPPTVPAGRSRLRVTLSAAHAESEVDGLVTALAEALAALPAGPAEEVAP